MKVPMKGKSAAAGQVMTPDYVMEFLAPASDWDFTVDPVDGMFQSVQAFRFFEDIREAGRGVSKITIQEREMINGEGLHRSLWVESQILRSDDDPRRDITTFNTRLLISENIQKLEKSMKATKMLSDELRADGAGEPFTSSLGLNKSTSTRLKTVGLLNSNPFPSKTTLEVYVGQDLTEPISFNN